MGVIIIEKKNCWEFKNCGRQPGGQKVAVLGICPASIEQRVGGIHSGINGEEFAGLLQELFAEIKYKVHLHQNFLIVLTAIFIKRFEAMKATK